MRQYFNYSLFVVGCFFILWRFLSFWSVFGCTLLCNHRFFAQSGTSSNFPRNKIALARIARAKSYSLTNHFSFNRHAISLAFVVFWLYTALQSSIFCSVIVFRPNAHWRSTQLTLCVRLLSLISNAVGLISKVPARNLSILT